MHGARHATRRPGVPRVSQSASLAVHALKRSYSSPRRIGRPFSFSQRPSKQDGSIVPKRAAFISSVANARHHLCLPLPGSWVARTKPPLDVSRGGIFHLNGVAYYQHGPGRHVDRPWRPSWAYSISNTKLYSTVVEATAVAAEPEAHTTYDALVPATSHNVRDEDYTSSPDYKDSWEASSTSSIPSLEADEEQPRTRHWARYGRRLETRRTVHIRMKHDHERRLRRNKEHPLRWNDLFCCLRRYTIPMALVQPDRGHQGSKEVSKQFELHSEEAAYSPENMNPSGSMPLWTSEADDEYMSHSGRANPEFEGILHERSTSRETPLNQDRDGRPSNASLTLEPTIKSTSLVNADDDRWTQDTVRVAILRILLAVASKGGLARPHGIMRATAKLKYTLEMAILKGKVPDLESIHKGLAFFIAHSELPYARGLMFSMRDFGLPATSETYGTFITGAANEQNLNAIEKYTKMMLKSNMRPGWQTWLALLDAAPSTTQKQRATREMHRRGFMDHDNVSGDVIPSVVGYSLSPYLDAGGRLEEYLDTITILWGPTWPSQHSIKAILDVLGSQGLTTTAMGLLARFRDKYGYQPDCVAMNALLAHQTLTLDVSPSLRTIAEFYHSFGIVPDGVTYDLLFRLAWTRQYYNIAKVVWKYACLTSCTTYGMHRRMKASLVASHSLDRPSTAGQRWLHKAGCVISSRKPSQPLIENWKYDSDVLDSEAESLAQQWLNEELNDWKNQDLIAPFATAIGEAWIRDRKWLRRRIRKDGEIDWMIKHSVDIDTKPSESQSSKPDVLSVGAGIRKQGSDSLSSDAVAFDYDLLRPHNIVESSELEDEEESTAISEEAEDHEQTSEDFSGAVDAAPLLGIDKDEANAVFNRRQKFDEIRRNIRFRRGRRSRLKSPSSRFRPMQGIRFVPLETAATYSPIPRKNRLTSTLITRPESIKAMQTVANLRTKYTGRQRDAAVSGKGKKRPWRRPVKRDAKDDWWAVGWRTMMK